MATSSSNLFSISILATTPLAQAAVGMTSGQWLQFRSPGQSNLVNSTFAVSGGTVFGYIDKGKYDPVRKKVLFIGKGQSGGEQRFMEYDEAADTWTELADPPWPALGQAGHAYECNSINPANSDYYYRVPGADVWRLRSGTWTQIGGSIPITFGVLAGAIEYFPAADAVIFCGRKQARLLDATSLSWVTPDSAFSGATLDIGDNHAVAQYSPGHNCVYFGGGNTGASGTALYRLNANRSVTTMPSAPANFAVATTMTFIDPASGHLYAINASQQWFYFNGSSWVGPVAITGSEPTLDVNDGFICFTLYAYGVVLILRKNGSTPDMWLYKP